MPESQAAAERAEAYVRQLLANMKSSGDNTSALGGLPRINYELAENIMAELVNYHPEAQNITIPLAVGTKPQAWIPEAFERVNNITGARVVGVTINDNLYGDILAALGHDPPKTRFRFIGANWVVEDDRLPNVPGDNELLCVTEVNRYVLVSLESEDVSTT